MRPSDSEYITSSDSYISTCESGGDLEDWTDGDYKKYNGYDRVSSPEPEETYTSESSSITEDSSNYTDPYTSDEDQEFKLVTRRRWRALPAVKTNTKVPSLWRPIGLVWFIYNTDTDPCYTLEDCKMVVRGMQKSYKQHKADLPFNFLVGGDGNVYEGRGWKKRPPNPINYPDEETNRIDVGYLGRFKRGQLTTKMLRGGLDLVSHGIYYRLLSHKYDSREWEKPGVPQSENFKDIFK